MGLLKHVILPLFALLHGYVTFRILVQNDIKGSIELFQWPPKAGKDQSLTLWEEHAIRILGGAHLAFFLACAFGVFLEHSHFRAIVALLELVYWVNGAYDATLKGFPCEVAYGLIGLTVVGLIAHAREPGLFTKDKAKTKTK